MNTSLRDGSYYNGFFADLALEISSNQHKTNETLFHELGHMLDNANSGKYHSSSYISKKYEMTLSDMVYKELHECDIDALIGEYENLSKLNNENWRKYDKGEITDDERNYYKAKCYYGAYLSVCDVIQGSYGFDFVREKLGNFTHANSYFDWKSDKYPEEADNHNKKNRGTELFAELTSDICHNDEHQFLKIMQKYAPKSVEIYFEILKENYGYEKQ